MARATVIFAGVFAVCVLMILGAVRDMINMPEKSFASNQPALTEHESDIRNHLQSSVETLASDIGERNTPETLAATVEWAEAQFKSYGLVVSEQPYQVNGITFKNVEGELRGSEHPDQIVIVCAHYDTVAGSPGANDNGSGCASVVEVARLLAPTKPKCTLRFVLFGTEEPPYFGTKGMGSYFYAKRCKERNEQLLAVIVMETLGYYSDAQKSQGYPSLLAPFLPSVGNYIAFVSNRQSRNLVERSVATFRRTTPFPSEGIAAPEWLTGVDWADQLWFWQMDYPAIMITDTAPYRYPNYHTRGDTPEKLKYPAFARVIGGMEQVIAKLGNPVR